MAESVRTSRIEPHPAVRQEKPATTPRLRRELGRRNSLGVDVDRGSKGRMPHQLLHDFEFGSGTPQQRRVGMSTLPNSVRAMAAQPERTSRNAILLFGSIRHSPACFTGSSGSSTTDRQDSEILSSL
jgi:hypothetical protein